MVHTVSVQQAEQMVSGDISFENILIPEDFGTNKYHQIKNMGLRG